MVASIGKVIAINTQKVNITQPGLTCSKLTIETLEQRCEICLKLTIKTPKRRRRFYCVSVSISIVFLLLTLNM